MFDIDRFLSECEVAADSDASQRAMREIARAAVSDSAGLLEALGEPRRAGLTSLYRSDNLTVLNVVWGPSMSVPPHNHEMWAVIAMYAGREDNIFWRRIEDEKGSTIEAAGAKSLCAGDAEPLGKDIVHSVLNPTDGLTGAIHFYGGDFFARERLEWDAATHRVHAYDVEATKRRFERSNILLDTLQT
jgi:predicted metal-dependent enzyme (double-stranded beta helix superfamily)